MDLFTGVDIELEPATLYHNIPDIIRGEVVENNSTSQQNISGQTIETTEDVIQRVRRSFDDIFSIPHVIGEIRPYNSIEPLTTFDSTQNLVSTSSIEQFYQPRPLIATPQSSHPIINKSSRNAEVMEQFNLLLKRDKLEKMTHSKKEKSKTTLLDNISNDEIDFIEQFQNIKKKISFMKRESTNIHISIQNIVKYIKCLEELKKKILMI